MKDFFELGKNLLLLLVVFLVVVFVSQTISLSVTPTANRAIDSSSSGEKRAGPKFAASTALITRVIDGDTVVIEGGKSVRLLGIDADEHDELCYAVAKERLIELVLNKQVVMEKELRDGDVYGRLLRYLFLDGQNVDLELVREGLVVARASWEGGTYDKQFADAERYAKQNKIGCKWSLTLKP